MDRVGKAESDRRRGDHHRRAARGHARAALVPARKAEPDRKPVLAGVVLDPATARKRARDEAWRSSPDGALMRAIVGG